MTFFMNICSASIEIPNEYNFNKWKKYLKFSLGIGDLDIALRETKPMINDQSTPEEKEKLAKWERSDQLSLYAMKRTISKHLISGFPEKENGKEYLTVIGERFKVSDNAESGCLMKRLTYMKYDNNGGVREFILKMVHAQTKLKSHDIDLNESFIVSHALNFLPAEFTQIKNVYNTFGDKWTINNLITKCVAEE
ncbi:uncharacterized protein LOC127130365 [Lathyrus oleraceus]|uniref:uncharacterized protein LOC127130365 n=1 Tax=Pisum sativum TaxID=3888 RepID=UPI0021CE127B|nr:uncharacterized protein LOC127130365 [Pisum sativum]